VERSQGLQVVVESYCFQGNKTRLRRVEVMEDSRHHSVVEHSNDRTVILPHSLDSPC